MNRLAEDDVLTEVVLRLGLTPLVRPRGNPAT